MVWTLQITDKDTGSEIRGRMKYDFIDEKSLSLDQ
jgi:hypothetical protein